MFLRNEPTVFLGYLLCILRTSRYLGGLQTAFAGGFVLENDPTGKRF
jgi:hypothetical protein